MIVEDKERSDGYARVILICFLSGIVFLWILDHLMPGMLGINEYPIHWGIWRRVVLRLSEVIGWVLASTIVGIIIAAFVLREKRKKTFAITFWITLGMGTFGAIY